MIQHHAAATKWAVFAAMVGCHFLAVPARSSNFTSIVSFGDSLSDVGNFYAATGGTSPPPPYTPGEFTNGWNWVQYLASDLGVATPTPSSSGGLDYAYGGAMTGSGGTSITFLGATANVPNTGDQIASYLNGHSPTSSDLFTIWAGADDLLHSATPNPFASADNVASEIATLAGAGGSQIIVGNLPLLGELPMIKELYPSAQIQQALDAMTLAFNGELQADLAALQGHLTAEVHLIDINSLIDDVDANPGKYGFTDTTGSAIGTSDGQGFLWWDGLHPTTQADAIVGRLAAQTVPEPSSWVLFATSLGCVGAWARRRREMDRVKSR
jgi:phospholipase/lecithinase/hemolysin